MIFMEKMQAWFEGASRRTLRSNAASEKISKENSPEKPAKENFAKTLALNIGKTSPVVYGFGFTEAWPSVLSSNLTKTPRFLRNEKFSLSLTITKL